MNKTKIPWCDFTINPVKGLCPIACSYCYARRMYKRFKWDETIRYDRSVYKFDDPYPDGSRVFVGSTMELFGDWVKPELMQDILDYCKTMTWQTFIFLTKKPENLIKWSPFPDNCWVGQSIEGGGFAIPTFRILGEDTGDFYNFEARIKFISFEPLLYRLTPYALYHLEKAIYDGVLNWIIIGSLTATSQNIAEMKNLYPHLTVVRYGNKYGLHPPREWVDEIIEAAGEIPVFVKEPLASHYDIQRQEFPKDGL